MVIALVILILILVAFSIWASSAFFGAPFQPSSDHALEKMIELSGIKSNNKKKLKVADLGSGNGKVVIWFAKRFPDIEAHGFEINPLLAWFSKRKVKSLKLDDRVFIHRKNFWKQNFKDFDIVTSFQINYAMPGLEKKFQKELKKGAKVVSNTWKFPHWKPEKRVKENLSEIFLYVK